MAEKLVNNTGLAEFASKIKENAVFIKGTQTSSPAIFDLIYPVGTEYVSYNTSFNPNTSFGGTWVENTDYQVVAYCAWDNGVLNSSKNISGLTRIGVGTYNVNFSKLMANTTYIISVNSEADGTGAECVGVYDKHTDYFRMDFCDVSGAVKDQTQISVMILGKLATPEYKIWKRTA